MVRKTPATAPRPLTVVPDGDLPDLGEPTAPGGPSGAEGPVDLPDLGITAAPLVPGDVPGGYVRIPLMSIVPSVDNPRADLDLDPEFLASVAEHGIIQPILVSPQTHGGGYDLIAGHRRYAAAVAAGHEIIPAIVRPAGDVTESEALRLVENLQRRDLTAVDEARAYERLIKVHGMTQAAVSLAVSRNQGHVSKRIKMLALGDVGLALVTAGTLNLEDATDLARMPAVVRDYAVDQIANGADPQFSVGNARRKVEELTERGAVIKALKAAGTAYVDLGAKGVVPEGARQVLPTHDCPALVVAVQRSKVYTPAGYSWTVGYCTDPESHDEGADVTEPGTTVAERQAENAADRAALLAESEALAGARAARADHRVEFIGSLLRGKLGRSTPDFIARMVALDLAADDVLEVPRLGEVAVLFAPDSVLVAEDPAERQKDAAAWAAGQIATGKGDALVRLALGRLLLGVAGDVTAAVRFQHVYGTESYLLVGLGYLQAAGYELDADEEAVLAMVSDTSLTDHVLAGVGLLAPPAEAEVADGNGDDDSSE